MTRVDTVLAMLVDVGRKFLTVTGAGESEDGFVAQVLEAGVSPR